MNQQTILVVSPWAYEHHVRGTKLEQEYQVQVTSYFSDKTTAYLLPNMTFIKVNGNLGECSIYEGCFERITTLETEWV